MKNILEGSQAIAQTINNIKPAVISAYPITPQTHIVEDLAKLKADGKANYEYVRAESEFAAASIVAGASAAGARVYTATSSQGLLLMAEVLFNIAGMRLPVVLTCANRGVSAPITIWNDHQDAMALRDAGWIMFFAENHQEAIEQHLLAYKVAEQTKLPAMVNIDGFVLTHTYEEAEIPTTAQIKKYLPVYKPAKGEFLDTANPVTFGAFAPPAYYFEIRQELQENLVASQKTIKTEYENLKKTIPAIIKKTEKETKINNGLVEYYGPKNAKTILTAMGSMVGTLKDAVDAYNKKKKTSSKVGVLKIKTYRPFPANDIFNIVKTAKNVAVVEKAISLGSIGPVALEVAAAVKNKTKTKVQSFVVGLGGRDITGAMISKIIRDVKGKDDRMKFVG
ncbi:MAG: transketolase C-terminal domain-containing protein [Patescibacteria group bacterium]|nr:transketolase C-terminal domain-containing protein [Patescibacteria group bacterium]